MLFVIIVAVVLYVIFKDEIMAFVQTPLVQSIISSVISIAQSLWQYAVYALQFIAFIFAKLAQYLQTMGN